jgi:hypothetical protein
MQAVSYAVQLVLNCDKKFFLYEVTEIVGGLVATVNF